SPDALDLGRENAALLGFSERVMFSQSDWFSAIPVDRRFELIVANPPYLSAAEVRDAAPEVRDFEPTSALTPARGPTGLEDIQTLVTQAPAFLEPGGLFALETGPAQHAEITASIAAAGFSRWASEPDLTGRDRFIFAWR